MSHERGSAERFGRDHKPVTRFQVDKGEEPGDRDCARKQQAGGGEFMCGVLLVGALFHKDIGNTCRSQQADCSCNGAQKCCQTCEQNGRVLMGAQLEKFVVTEQTIEEGVADGDGVEIVADIPDISDGKMLDGVDKICEHQFL